MPEESASHCTSSMIRSSYAASRAAAEVRSRTARQKAEIEARISAIKQEIALLDAEAEEQAAQAEEAEFEWVMSMDVPSRRLAPQSRSEPSLLSQSWRKSYPASQQWERPYPASQQWETSYPMSQ